MLTLTNTYLWSLAWTEGDLCRAGYIVLSWIGRGWFWQAGGAPHHWRVGEVRPHPYDLQLYITSILIEMVLRQGPVNARLWIERNRIHLNKCQHFPIERWLIISHTFFFLHYRYSIFQNLLKKKSNDLPSLGPSMMTVAEDRVPIFALYEESESLNSNSSGLSKRLSSITW